MAEIIEETGKGLRIGILCTRTQWEITSKLAVRVKKSLLTKGVERQDIVFETVTRSLELPLAAAQLLKRDPTLDALVCVGCLVQANLGRGYEVVANAVANGIMKLNMKGNIPVIYAILTCTNHTQATKFLGHEKDPVDVDYGDEWANAAIEQAKLKKVSDAAKKGIKHSKSCCKCP
jgi:6,7-dimethyl-8-ribityllumazine synthase